jgi:hypothetical protein
MYARDMEAGRWQLTHQGIAFNNSGELIDGQHRLLAIIEANVAIKMVVSTGMALEYDAPIDQGYGRKMHHVMHLTHRRVAALRALTLLEAGRFTKRREKASQAELQTALEHHHDALAAVIVDERKQHGGLIGALAYAWPIAPDLVSSLARQIATGELIQKADPAYAWRRWAERGGALGCTENVVFAACNVVAQAIKGETLEKVYTGPSGYRWIVTKRRVLRLPHTPAASAVPTYSTGRVRANDEKISDDSDP